MEEDIEVLLKESEKENQVLEKKIEELESELKLVRYILNETRTIFRVNMLRAYPTITHADIDDALNSVLRNVGLYKL